MEITKLGGGRRRKRGKKFPSRTVMTGRRNYDKGFLIRMANLQDRLRLALKTLVTIFAIFLHDVAVMKRINSFTSTCFSSKIRHS